MKVSLSKFLVFVGLLFSSDVTADDFPIVEYEANVKRYIKNLEGISGEVSSKDFFLESGDPYNKQSTFISMEKHFLANLKLSGKSGKITSKWALLRPDGYFVIKELPNDSYSLYSHESNVHKMEELQDGESCLMSLMMPVMRNDLLLLDLIQGKIKNQKHVFHNFKKTTGNANEIVYEVESLVPGTDSKSKYQFDETWLLSKCWMSSTKNQISKEFSYSYMTFQNRTLPSKIVISGVYKGKPIRDVAFDFSGYQLYRGSMSEFRLAKFGLPEPVTVTPPPPNRNFLWITLASVAAVIIAVLVRRKINSLEAKAS